MMNSILQTEKILDGWMDANIALISKEGQDFIKKNYHLIQNND